MKNEARFLHDVLYAFSVVSNGRNAAATVVVVVVAHGVVRSAARARSLMTDGPCGARA